MPGLCVEQGLEGKVEGMVTVRGCDCASGRAHMVSEELENGSRIDDVGR